MVLENLDNWWKQNKSRLHIICKLNLGCITKFNKKVQTVKLLEWHREHLHNFGLDKDVFDNAQKTLTRKDKLDLIRIKVIYLSKDTLRKNNRPMEEDICITYTDIRLVSGMYEEFPKYIEWTGA